jgi:hypothetical protein
MLLNVARWLKTRPFQNRVVYNVHDSSAPCESLFDAARLLVYAGNFYFIFPVTLWRGVSRCLVLLVTLTIPVVCIVLIHIHIHTHNTYAYTYTHTYTYIYTHTYIYIHTQTPSRRQCGIHTHTHTHTHTDAKQEAARHLATPVPPSPYLCTYTLRRPPHNTYTHTHTQTPSRRQRGIWRHPSPPHQYSQPTHLPS